MYIYNFIFLLLQIISWLKDYYVPEKHLLLPPFQPGASLPPEVLEAFQAAKDKAKEKTLEPDNSQPPSEINIAETSSYLSFEQQPSTIPGKGFADGLGSYDEKYKHPQSSTSRSIDSSTSSLNKITEVTSFHFPGDDDRTIDGYCVEEALARHVGVDITKEGLEAEKRRGVAVVIHGTVTSGKTTQAKALASYYQGQVFDLDKILIQAISSAKTEAGQKARMHCLQAMKLKSESLLEPTLQPPGLKKQMTIKEKEKEVQPTEAVSYLKNPILFQIDPHLDTPFAVPEGSLLPTVIPEDYFVQILSERFMKEDCLKGIVLDGIDSSFSSNSLPLVLRAFNNRTHIYFISLDMELEEIKDRHFEIEHQKMLKIKEEEAKKKEAIEREEQRILSLLNMDEDEYEALPEEKQEEIDAIRLKRKKALRLEKQKEREEKERLEQLKKEEERLREEDKKKKKKDKKAPSKLHMAGNAGNIQPSRSGSVLSTVAPSPMHGPGTDSRTSLISPADSPGQFTTPRHPKMKRKVSPKSGRTDITECDTVMFEKKVNQYKLGLMGLKSILEDWDRQKGITRFKKVEEDIKATPSKKPKSKTKEEPVTVPEEEDDNREGIGVPFLELNGNKPEHELFDALFASGLPSSDKILDGMGLGPSGIPIPSPVTLQVCPYPLKRVPVKQESRIFSFITTSPDDP